MLADLRFAARFLSKSPLFALGVMSLIVLGVAANVVIFSLVDALLIRQLPVRSPERLVRLISVRPPLPPKGEFLYREYEDWRKNVGGFEDLLGWSEQSMFVRVGGLTERGQVDFVSDNFFSALGTLPLLGRVLGPDDQSAAGGTAPAVLSYTYWQRRFAADPAVVGKTVALDGHPVVIVGVSPKGFNGLTVETGPDVRLPIGWLRVLRPNSDDSNIYCEVVGRLRAGVPTEQVRQQAEALWRARWLERNRTDTAVPSAFAFEPAARGISRMRAQFRGVLLLLMGGVGLLLFMVCANIAGLLIARTAGRQRELAVRVALGATRFQIARPLFCEALLLTIGGTAGAVALSFTVMPLLERGLPTIRDLAATKLTLSLSVAPDLRGLGFALFLSAVAVLFFGVVPAIMAARRNLHPLLKDMRSQFAGHGRQVVVAMQVALCTLLAVGAGLTILTLHRLDRLDAGFDRERVVTFQVDPAMGGYNVEEIEVLRRRLIEEAAKVPGVEFAATSGRGLMRGTGVKMTARRAGERADEGDFLNTSINVVSPEYFAVMGIDWVEGRNFTGREDPLARPMPVVVNESFAKRILRAQVIGTRFGSAVIGGKPAPANFEVIGVVRDTKYRSLREPFQPIVYQLPSPRGGFILHLRTKANPASVIGPMHALLSRVDPRLSYVDVVTLEDEVKVSLWAERVAAFLATLLSIAATVISAAGLYTLIAFIVGQRRREMGVRMALGAQPWSLVWLTMVRAAWPVLLGVALGLLSAWTILPQITPILYQVEPRDLTVLGRAAGAVLLVSAIAALVPSLAALRLQPASVLRQE